MFKVFEYVLVIFRTTMFLYNDFSLQPNSLQTSALSSRDIPMVTTGTSISNVHHAETTEEDKDLPPAYDTLFPNR